MADPVVPENESPIGAESYAAAPVPVVPLPGDLRAQGELWEAAEAFVASTSYWRQREECREQFERLAVSVLAMDEAESNG